MSDQSEQLPNEKKIHKNIDLNAMTLKYGIIKLCIYIYKIFTEYHSEMTQNNKLLRV